MGNWAQRIERRLSELAPLGKDRPGLARACGVKLSSVSGWFGKGAKQTQMIRGDNLVAAARYLNTSPEWIMHGTGSPNVSQTARPDPAILTDAVRAVQDLMDMQAGEARDLWDARLLLAIYDELSRTPPDSHEAWEAVLRRVAAVVREVRNGGKEVEPGAARRAGREAVGSSR